MIRVVFDTVVIVRGLINPASFWGRLIFEHASEYRLIVSQPIVIEVLEVIRRPRLQRKYRGIASRNIETIIGIIASAEHVELEHVPAITRDPKDDKFPATAMLAGAEYIVSEDEDLLTLGVYEEIRIVTAEAFLTILEHARPASS